MKYVDPDGRSSVLNIWILVNIGYKLHHNYSKNRGSKILDTITSSKTVNCSSMDLYYLYKSGQGKNVTLTEIGLLGTIQNSIEKGTNNTKTGESIQSRFIAQLKSENGTSFERSYEFENEKFAIGEATISGSFNGNITKNKDGSSHIEGTITYSFSDKFTDPYDLFNLTKGKEWNPDGKSYMITDSWTVNINGDY